MSRRTAIVEDFEDDTDLPLPARPLPNTGTKGAILEEISSDTDDPELADFDYEEGVNTARPAPPRPTPTPGPANLQPRPPAALSGTVTDITPYKTFVDHHLHFARALTIVD
jgi:signal recognition particle subunit SRP19